MPACRCDGIGLDRGDHEVGVDAVGDERLGAVDDVVVAVADGATCSSTRGRSRCPARSCAIAVMSSPDAMPGSQRACCSSSASERK